MIWFVLSVVLTPAIDALLITTGLSRHLLFGLPGHADVWTTEPLVFALPSAVGGLAAHLGYRRTRRRLLFLLCLILNCAYVAFWIIGTIYSWGTDHV